MHVILILVVFTLAVNIGLALWFTLPVAQEADQEIVYSVTGSVNSDESINENNEENTLSTDFVSEQAIEEELTQPTTIAQNLANESADTSETIAENMAESDTSTQNMTDTFSTEDTANPQTSESASQDDAMPLPEQISAQAEEVQQDFSNIGQAYVDFAGEGSSFMGDPAYSGGATENLEEETETPQEQDAIEQDSTVQEEIISESDEAHEIDEEVTVEQEELEEEVVQMEEVEEEPAPARMIVEEITIGYSNKILTFRVQANQPIDARTLYVGNPERAILDLIGIWTLPEMPMFPVNPYSTGVRTGFQEDTTRFVIDITTTDFIRNLVQVRNDIVELRVTFEPEPQ